MGIGHPPTAIHNVFQYGALGGIRAHKTLCLRQVRIPIPSPGQIQQDRFSWTGFEPATVSFAN